MYKKLFFKILVVITIITTVNARNGYDPLTFVETHELGHANA